jgi:hypothetical protein
VIPITMNHQRHEHPAGRGGWGPSPSRQRWESTDDAALVQLITTVVAGVILMAPALLLIDQLSPSLGPSLTATPRSLERIALD